MARSLLHGAPCPVALAPRGFSRRPAPDRVRVVGVAFDGSPESELALAEAIVLARALDARVRLVGVAHASELFPDPAWLGLGDKRYANALHERRRHELERGSTTVPEPLRASSALVIGEPAHALRREAERGMGLLVVGSRGYGPLRQVLLGSVAADLLHAAPCPVIVCPRGSE